MASSTTTWRKSKLTRSRQAPNSDASLDELSRTLSSAGARSARLQPKEEEARGAALVADAHELGQALVAAGHKARPLERAGPGAETLIAVAAGTSSEALGNLGQDLAQGALGVAPTWLALDAKLDPTPLLAALESEGLFLAEGKISFVTGGSKRARFDLYRAPVAPIRPFKASPYPEKRGEGPGHLEGREDYFKKRTGTK